MFCIGNTEDKPAIYNLNNDKCFLVLVIYISLLCFISLFFFSQKEENNRSKKKPVGQNFVILYIYIYFLLQIGPVGTVDQ